MSKLPFTPGPWLSVGYIGEYEKIIGINPTVEVCRVRRHADNRNSLLIQHARELLAHLESLMDALEGRVHGGECGCDLCEAYHAADKLTNRFYVDAPIPKPEPREF